MKRLVANSPKKKVYIFRYGPCILIVLNLKPFGVLLSIDIAVLVRRSFTEKMTSIDNKMSNSLSFRYFSKRQGFYITKKLTSLIKARMNTDKSGYVKKIRPKFPIFDLLAFFRRLQLPWLWLHKEIHLFIFKKYISFYFRYSIHTIITHSWLQN